MQRTLLFIGGIFNALFFVFHLFLGYQIHFIQNIDPESRALMQMLNVGGSLMIAFFAVASLVYVNELGSTRLGRLVLLLVALFYGSRALEEIIISPSFSSGIFVTCLIVAVIYLVTFFLSSSTDKTTTSATTA